MATPANRRDTEWEVWYSILEASIDLYTYLGVTVNAPVFFSDKTALNRRDNIIEMQQKILAIFAALEGT